MEDMEQTNEQTTLPVKDKDAAFWANIDERKAAIESRLMRKVFPLVVADRQTADFIVGFAYEPDLTTKLRLIDKSSGMEHGISVEACSSVLDSLIIAGETDERITAKKDHEYWIGASYCLAQFMGTAIPVFKKK